MAESVQTSSPLLPRLAMNLSHVPRARIADLRKQKKRRACREQARLFPVLMVFSRLLLLSRRQFQVEIGVRIQLFLDILSCAFRITTALVLYGCSGDRSEAARCAGDAGAVMLVAVMSRVGIATRFWCRGSYRSVLAEYLHAGDWHEIRN